MKLSALWPLAAAAALAVTPPHAGAAVVESTAPSGLRFSSGGVGDEELAAMRSRAGAYTLRVATAAKSGAHLAAVQARIADASGRVLLDHRMEGPWLLAALPPGRYRLELRFTPAGGAEHVQRHDITVGERGLTEFTARFDVAP